MVAFTIEVLDKEFQAAASEASKQVDDLTPVYKLMTEDWFKSNRSIFALKGPGKYKAQDLSDAYKKAKLNKWHFVYPILKASGALAKSITEPGGESIAKVINKKTLVLGTTTPYGIFHQLGTNRMPARPFVLLGAEQTATPEINLRRELWIKRMNDYVFQKTKGAFGTEYTG